MTDFFTSEFSEDAWIAQNLPLPASGTYCDVGCAWPELRSNTAFLRARGWKGICVDGNDFWRHYWDQTPNAVFINAVVSNEERAMFDKDGPPDMARIKPIGARGSTVPCVPLEHLLVAHGIEHLDFLSLDVEGSEFQCLLSLNLARHCPGIIVSEYNTHGIGEDFRVKEYLEAAGYSEVHRTVANIVYVK